MKTKYIDLNPNRIELPSFNFKKNDPEKLARLKIVIKNRGQVIPIQIYELENGTYQLISGSKILQCLIELEVDKVTCYNHGKISLNEAKRIALETDLQNYETDHVGLAEMIEDLVMHYQVYDLSLTIPLSQDDFITYTNYLKFDWYGEEKMMEERTKRSVAKKKKKAANRDRKPSSSNPSFISINVESIMNELINS